MADSARRQNDNITKFSLSPPPRHGTVESSIGYFQQTLTVYLPHLQYTSFASPHPDDLKIKCTDNDHAVLCHAMQIEGDP